MGLKFKNKKGKLCIWDKDSFERHKLKHPELNDETFIDRVKRALDKPNVIIKSHTNHFLCYYYLEFTIEDVKWYTKVVVEEKVDLITIKTAFRLNNIKELKYHKPIWENH